MQTVAAQESNTVGVTVTSPLLQRGRLGVFLDFPWNDGVQKFEAPFVGVWNATSNHTTALRTGGGLGRNIQAQIAHTMDATTFFTSVGGDDFAVTRVSPDAHRYEIVPRRGQKEFSVAVAYSPGAVQAVASVEEIQRESQQAWQDFWSNHGFVDVLTGSADTRAEELQRRIILSQYLLRVNEAGDYPPQEVGHIAVCRGHCSLILRSPA